MAKNKQLQEISEMTEFLIYTTPSGKIRVEAFVYNENIWLTQDKIADLFDVDRSVVTKHLRNIFNTQELKEDSVCAKFAHTATDSKKYLTKFYNLDAIISVGYRVNSAQATHFRIWATEHLKEYIIKGFTMDDERLKNPHNIFGKHVHLEPLSDEHLSGLIEATNGGDIWKLWYTSAPPIPGQMVEYVKFALNKQEKLLQSYS